MTIHVTITYQGSNVIPYFEITCSKKDTSSSKNSHIVNLAYNWCSLRLIELSSNALYFVLKYTKITSMNTVNYCKYFLKMQFMRSMKMIVHW